MTFLAIEKKIQRPPAAHNVARLLDPSCEIKTTQNIAKFALSVPAFNYIPALKVCRDRVGMKLDIETAERAVKNAGAPAGREQNAALVRSFFAFDEVRGYSELRTLDDYEGQYRISREIVVPTKPTFTVLERGKQVPIVICGWKDLILSKDQLRAWITMLDSGLFSFSDYRSSPWETLLFPEVDSEDGKKRAPHIIRRGDIDVYSEASMRELSAMYARAQRAAMPLARDMYEDRERRRRERLRDVEGPQPDVTPPHSDLFARK